MQCVMWIKGVQYLGPGSWMGASRWKSSLGQCVVLILLILPIRL